MAILDMNEELASEVVKEISREKTKFFETNVLETDSIEKAVKGAVDWSKETGKTFGGVVAAAGVSTPAKVSLSSLEKLLCGLSGCLFNALPWKIGCRIYSVKRSNVT